MKFDVFVLSWIVKMNSAADIYENLTHLKKYAFIQ